jgi:hypothetical protein
MVIQQRGEKLFNPRIAPKMFLSTTISETLTQPTEAS